MDDPNLSSSVLQLGDASDAPRISPSASASLRISGLHSSVSSLVNEDLSGYREIEGEYDVGEQIGRGGCAVVLEAWRKTDRLHVVIKVLQVPPGFDEHEAHVALARFMREAELIASLHEEHIVQCVDYGCYQGIPCMVLEFVDGRPLDVHLREYGSMPLELASDITIQLLSALVETHGKKIIHRDIKPGNIMVLGDTAPFRIKVLDFGISSVLDGFQSQTLMTQQGSIRGTPSYMAPELFTGETHASIESDLYAAGLVFLECLTNEIAFNDKSCMQVAYKQVNEDLEIPLFVPPTIAQIIAKLCEKAVEDRYHSAQDVIDDIRAALPEALAVEEKCKAAWEKEQKKRKPKRKRTASQRYSSSQITAVWYRRPSILTAVAVVVIAILVLLIVVFSMQRKANDALAAQQAAPIVIQVNAEADPENAEEQEKLKRELLLARSKSAVKESVGAVSAAFGFAHSDVSGIEKKEAANNKKKPAKGKSGSRRPSDTRVKTIGII